ncbi:MAGE-like protein 2 [Penaeus indicus]|uniref:MAGE-like protein 2 n=1 Tax=Penaeus indicus TaxID=29960 RepID=UPI00300D3C6D
MAICYDKWWQDTDTHSAPDTDTRHPTPDNSRQQPTTTAQDSDKAEDVDMMLTLSGGDSSLAEDEAELQRPAKETLPARYTDANNEPPSAPGDSLATPCPLAIPWRSPGDSLAIFWCPPGDSLATLWQPPDNPLATPGDPLATPDNPLAIPWQPSGNPLVSPWQPPDNPLATPGDPLATPWRLPGDPLPL